MRRNRAVSPVTIICGCWSIRLACVVCGDIVGVYYSWCPSCILLVKVRARSDAYNLHVHGSLGAVIWYRAYFSHCCRCRRVVACLAMVDDVESWSLKELWGANARLSPHVLESISRQLIRGNSQLRHLLDNLILATRSFGRLQIFLAPSPMSPTRRPSSMLLPKAPPSPSSLPFSIPLPEEPDTSTRGTHPISNPPHALICRPIPFVDSRLYSACPTDPSPSTVEQSKTTLPSEFFHSRLKSRLDWVCGLVPVVNGDRRRDTVQ